MSAVNRVLITGMSGTGKSAALEELAARGYRAVDTDDAGWCEAQSGADGTPELVWRTEPMRTLLEAPSDIHLFVGGCVSNQGRFYGYFGHVVLLSAQLEVLRGRILARSTNPYGKADHEWQQIVRDTAEVLPLLRTGADLEIDTSDLSVAEVTDTLLSLVSSNEDR